MHDAKGHCTTVRAKPPLAYCFSFSSFFFCSYFSNTTQATPQRISGIVLSKLPRGFGPPFPSSDEPLHTVVLLISKVICQKSGQPLLASDKDALWRSRTDNRVPLCVVRIHTTAVAQVLHVHGFVFRLPEGGFLSCHYPPALSPYFAVTDSPCPKLKPVSKAEKAGFLQLSTQPYGGGLWHTWFDRDLGVAGRAIVKRGDGKYSHDLVSFCCLLCWIFKTKDQLVLGLVDLCCRRR